MGLTRARQGAGVVAAIALSLVALTGAALTWRYRPDGGNPGYLLPPAVRWSRQLVRGHEASMAVAVPALFIWAGLTAWDRTPWSRRKGIGVASATTAVALTALTAGAWQRVRWDQLGLWAVTVGDEVRGLWYAAFSDQVRFAFVNGGEVRPADMAPWVVVHLLGPMLAVAVVALGWRAVESPRTPRRSIASVPDDSSPTTA